MRAMVLAAGRGKRLRPLTDTCPKPLLTAAGRTLLEYHLRSLAAADITEVVINTSWLATYVHRFVGDGSRFGLNVQISHEGDSALETGGGIRRALPMLGDEPFLVVNGDVYTDYPFASIAPLGPEELARLVLVPNPGHNPKGDFALCNGALVNHGDPMHTFSGIGVYRPELFDGTQDTAFPLAPLLRRAADAGQAVGERFTGVWSDVGTAARLEALERYLLGDATTPC